MRRFISLSSLLLGLIVLLAVLVISCEPNRETPEYLVEAQATAVFPTPANRALNLTPLATLATAEPFTDFACLDCHTDQARLMELALPDEPEESLSSGPG